jgi:hypothetical protein
MFAAAQMLLLMMMMMQPWASGPDWLLRPAAAAAAGQAQTLVAHPAEEALLMPLPLAVVQQCRQLQRGH